MKPRVVLLRLVASTALLLVSAVAIATVTFPVVDVAADTITTTHEAIIIREGTRPPEITVPQPPPPPREEMRMPPPSQGQVWLPGYWSWNNNEWAWMPGRLEKPPERMATWVPGQWTQRGDAWVWRSGHWE
jgi:hypothetical protein